MARIGKSRASRKLGLRERDAETFAYSHDLASRAHLWAEHGVDARKTTEGQHRFFHTDVRRRRRRVGNNALGSQFAERVAHHDPHRHLGQCHARGLRDKGNRSTSARVRFEHEDLLVLYGVLHIDKPHNLEGGGDLSGVVSHRVEYVPAE